VDYIARTTKGNWASVIRKKYWENQKQALAMALGYLKNPGTKQAMVRMPTGTGKTGVIATLARLLPDHSRCLVVAPWRSLVEQLKKELSSRWWEKIEEQHDLMSRTCVSVTPKVSTAALNQLKREGVILCTHQTLQRIHTDPILYGQLKKWCSLVLVDEGHREPAPEWSRAIRELEHPTLLLTATPYRNDLRLFNVSSDFFYTYTFPEAVDDNVVRAVDFERATWSQGGQNRASDFSAALVSAVKKHTRDVNSDFRVIVRCDTEQEVRDVVAELDRRAEKVIGIHERFTRADGKLFRKKLPDPDKEPAKYWVHQWKMLEGLDDPRFRLLAIYAPFTNARNLVQQVGRIIRNPDRLPNQRAWVLSHGDHGQQQLWDNFCGYESEVRTRKEAGESELTIFDDFVQFHLSTPRFYLLGDFRRGLSSNDISDPRQFVRLRKSVIALKPKRKFIWNDFIDSIQKELLGENAIPFGSSLRTDDTYLQLYQLLEQSPIVTEAFMDVGLGYVFAGMRERLLFLAT
jgi:superfamily II DNA or RNA helicase